jgi:hypothetical protein
MQKKTVRKRYVLSEDYNNDWYLIPLEHLEAWVAWCKLPADDATSWQAPQWAHPIQGSPSDVTFENPSIVS